MIVAVARVKDFQFLVLMHFVFYMSGPPTTPDTRHQLKNREQRALGFGIQIGIPWLNWLMQHMAK